MFRWAQSSALGVCSVCIALVTACDDDTEVQRQTRELEQAQKEVPEVTAQLEKDLEKARGDVGNLEAKLALARQGLTDDVIENQRELEQALKDQQEQVRTELSEAQREAQIHDRDTTAALKQLQQTATTAANPPGEPAPAAPPAAPAATSEPLHPNDVVRVHGEDPAAGGDPMTPPSSAAQPNAPAPTPEPPVAPPPAPSDPAPTSPAPPDPAATSPAPSDPAPPSPAPAPGPLPSTPN